MSLKFSAIIFIRRVGFLRQNTAQHIVVVVAVYKWQSHESSAKIDNLLVNKWPHQPYLQADGGGVHIYMHKTHHTHNCFCQKGPKEQSINGSYMRFPSFLFYKDTIAASATKHYIYRAINNPPFCMLLNLNYAYSEEPALASSHEAIPWQTQVLFGNWDEFLNDACTLVK